MNIKAISSIILSSALFLPVSAASAAPEHGVKCPSGTTANFQNNILHCYKKVAETVRSVCPDTAPVMERRIGKADLCYASRLVTFGTFNVVGVPSIPDSASSANFTRIVDGAPDTIGTDSFKRIAAAFSHPAGTTYAHNPANGVKCGRGYQSVFTPGRLKCQKSVARVAACPFPWALVVKSGKDYCKLGNGKTQTVPKGTISRAGWDLHADYSRGIGDVWKKLFHAYPRNAR